MPKIEPYNLQTTPSGPVGQQQATGADAGSGAAWQQFGQATVQAGSLLERRQQQIEVTDLNAKLSQAHSEALDNLRDSLAKSTPGDSNFASNFMNGAENDDSDTGLKGKLADIGANISTRVGQDFFNTHSARMLEEFDQKANLGQANLMSQHTIQETQASLDRDTAAILKDPNSYDSLLAKQLSNIKTKQENSEFGKGAKDLPEKMAAQVKRAYGMAQVQGFIRADAESTKDELESGDFNNKLGAKDIEFLIGKANQQIRANDLADEKQRRDDKLDLEEAQKKTGNDFLNRISNNTLTPQMILDSNLNPTGLGSKKEYLDLLTKDIRNANSQITDKATFNALWNRIHLPTGDSHKITDPNELNHYLSEGLLNKNDLKELRGEIDLKGTPEGNDESSLKKAFTDGWKIKLDKTNPQLGIADPQGTENYGTFLAHFQREYQKQRAAGVLPQVLLDPKNSNGLNYIGETYAKTPKQLLDANLEYYKKLNAPPPAPSGKPKSPRNAGESPDAYLKRIGIKK